MPDRKEASAPKRRFFERKSSMLDDDVADRKAVAVSREPSDDVTKVFSSLATVFDFADFASTHGKVSSENEVFVNLIQRVRQDVTEASRLYTSQAVTEYLESWPDKKTWIDAILLDIQRALNDIGVYMETVRIIGDDGGTAGLRRKFDWVLSHHKKLISKQQYLALCHSSLMAAVQIMQTAEINATYGGQDPIYEAPARPWVKSEERDILRSPHSRQRWRMSQRNLSLPSIHISDAEGDKLETRSINSVPAELPGSTPDDLPDANNWDLYALPQKPRRSSVDETQQRALDETIAHLPMDEGTVDAGPSQSGLHRRTHQTLQRPLIDPLSARRSFDQARPSVSSLQTPSRASLDQPRPRAYSDQVRPQMLFDPRPRASFDQIRPLPTLNEKPLDRYDSTASVSVKDAATVPLGGMRYRPKAVHVRKPPPRHRSLPSELPSLSSQTSLLDELSHWVLPPSARESCQSYHSIDTNTSLEASTPGTSVASSPVLSNSSTTSPVIPQAAPERAASLASSRTSSITRKPLPSGAAIPILRSEPSTELPNVDTDFEEPKAPSLSEDIPEEESSEPSLEGSTTPLQTLPSDASNSQETINAVNPVMTSDTKSPLEDPPNSPEVGSDTVSAITPSTENTSSPAPVPSATNDTEEERAIAKFDSPTSTVPQVLESSVASTDSAQTPLPQERIVKNTETAVESPPAPPPRRMTAQAKRRAAHARRMQLSFGAE